MGDHLVAHPEQWRELGKALPEPAEMNRALLESIEARPADYAAPLEHPDSASDTLDTPGTYRAGVVGAEAKPRLRETYRTLMMRIAAHDLAGTFHSRKGQTTPQPAVPFTDVTRRTTALADAALTAALAVACGTVYGLSLIHI